MGYLRQSLGDYAFGCLAEACNLDCVRNAGIVGLVRRTVARDSERQNDVALTASEAGRAARAEAGRQFGGSGAGHRWRRPL